LRDVLVSAIGSGDAKPGDDEDCVEAFVDDAVADSPAVESATVCPTFGFGFCGGKSSCESAMTISDRNSARKKRLSIRVPDRSRRPGMGGSAGFA